MSKKLLSFPYLLWMAGFTIIPLGLILYFGLTDKSGAFTLANVAAIATPEHAKALGLSLALSLAATLLCLLFAYPLAMILRSRNFRQHFYRIYFYSSHVDELSAAHPGLADPSGKKRCN